MAGQDARTELPGPGSAGEAVPGGSLITLVFVDLVNSTALKAALPGADITARNHSYFEAILTPYRQRVEAELAAFGGRVVKTAGDDHFLVFGSAARAAQWAAALQSRQESEPIPTPLGSLQVRIGMHTGAPLSDPQDAGDYIGHEVDYAKRVSALASGGQILLSEITAVLVREARMAGLALHAHGERELKGIGRVPLFELLHDEKGPQPLQASPLPLATGAAGELPSAALLDALGCSRIIGRDAEMAELRRRVDAALQGKWDEVGQVFRRAIPLGGPSLLFLQFSLGAMEEELNRAGKAGEFIDFCEEAGALLARAGLSPPLKQWYLRPAAPSEAFRQLLFGDDFDAPELRPEWQWQDPVQASRYSLAEWPGHLTLRADRSTDLWPRQNLNAPRVLFEVRGDFALEAKVEGDWGGSSSGPSGLLVWKDVLNYVRLDKFAHNHMHRGDIRLEARVNGAVACFGRGQLPGDTYHLRLERTGERFAALCRVPTEGGCDGVHWLSCGQVSFPAKDPLWVGVWAGRGMVAHFDSVQVLGRG